MFGRIILILAICAIAHAVILPLKMENTDLIERDNNRHLVKREALSFLQSIVQSIINFIYKAMGKISTIGTDFLSFSNGLRTDSKKLFGIED